jgi:hypothetical protein
MLLFAYHCLDKFVKKLRGRTELEDTLGRLDRLTQEQVWMMTAEILRSTFDIDHKIHTIMDGAQIILRDCPSMC